MFLFGGPSNRTVKLQTENARMDEQIKGLEKDNIRLESEKTDAVARAEYHRQRADGFTRMDSALIEIIKANRINYIINDKRLKDIDDRYRSPDKERLRGEFADY